MDPQNPPRSAPRDMRSVYNYHINILYFVFVQLFDTGNGQSHDNHVETVIILYGNTQSHGNHMEIGVY